MSGGTSRFFEILVARVPFFRPNEFWSGDRVIFSPAEVEKRTHRDSLEAALGWETRLSFLERASEQGEERKTVWCPPLKIIQRRSLDSLEISTRQWTLVAYSSAYSRHVKSRSEFEFEGTRQFDEDRYEGELKWNFVKFFVVVFIRGGTSLADNLRKYLLIRLE